MIPFLLLSPLSSLLANYSEVEALPTFSDNVKTSETASPVVQNAFMQTLEVAETFPMEMDVGVDLYVVDDMHSHASVANNEDYEEQITTVETSPAKVIEVEDEEESYIVDDIHVQPTIIKMKDYQDAKTESVAAVPASNSHTKIIKYINPQMYNVNLSQPSQQIDFWELLSIAMEKSASLILKSHDMKITKSNLAILKSEYYPNLSLRYYNEYYHGFSRSGSTNIGGSVYPSSSEYRNSLSLNMDYEVYRFGASNLKMEMGELDMAILRSDIELEKERIAKDLLKNYTVALKAQETIKTKKKILLVKNILLDNTQRLYDAGFASRTDIARLRIDAVSIEKEILRSRLRILDAMKDIHILSNVDIDIKKMGLAMLEPSESSEKEFEATALSYKIKLQIDKKIKEIELIKKDYLPTLVANGAYQVYGGDKNNVFDAIGELQRNNWNIGITLKWDIFNGFKTDNTIQRAKLEIEKLIEQHRLEGITFAAREEKRVLLREMIDKILSEENVLLSETAIQKDLLERLQKSGNISIMEVDKIEVARLQSELDFKIEVINQVNEDILSQLIM